MKQSYSIRHSGHPEDVKHYTTERLRKEHLISSILTSNGINMVYTFYDRMIAGGAVPIDEVLDLQPIEVLKSNYFTERREIGIINVGGAGEVITSAGSFELGYEDALYIGKGVEKISFKSKDPLKPSRFYFNSLPAHKEFPTTIIKIADAEKVELGQLETSNNRRINKLLINSRVNSCQLQMGLTQLMPGSVWNTMPAHTHNRRMEVYFYFEVPEDQAVCHFMGEPHETRHIWMKNEEAVISPYWSIHSAAGTHNYKFIWGMGGENLDYSDMDFFKITDLK